MSNALLSEVLGYEVLRYDGIHHDYIKDGVEYTLYPLNIHELVFDKCIEWAWEQGYSITMFRANNIFHARVHGDDVEERRFYSNPDDKYDAVIQACEWILKRRL